MTSLKTLLEAHSWRMLRAIAYAHGRTFDAQLSKEDALRHTTAWLEAALSSKNTLGQLPPQAHLALRTLHLAAGSLPRHLFEARFGPIREYRPWRAESPQAPWRDPVSPAETLYYLGLVFIRPGAAGEVIVIPDELRELLPPLAPEAPPPVAAAPHRRDLVLDLVHFLAYLQGHAVHPLAGRWLAPAHFRALNDHLAHPDPAVAKARSELQCGTLRFIHYLAEVSGLVAPVMGCLAPTPEAFAWLTAGEADRLRHLGRAWARDLRARSAGASRWSRYRFPGSPAAVAVCLDALASLPPGRYALDALHNEFEARAAAAGIPLEAEADAPLFPALLAGPFAWADWLRPAVDDRVIWTPVGAAWLHDAAPEAPTPPTIPARTEAVTETTLRLALPPLPARPPLRPLLDLALPVPEDDDAPTLHRCLSQRHFAALRSRGRSCAWISERLRALLGGALPGVIQEQLEAWEAAVTGLTLRRLTVLEIGDLELRDALLAQRRIRECVNETLSPHHLAVDAQRVALLLRALHRRAHFPLMEPEVLRVPLESAASGDEPPAMALDADAAAYLWLALRALFDLGDLIELPVAPPASLLESLNAALGGRIEGLDALAVQIEAQLRDAVDGYTPFAAPLLASDVDALRATIEQAIARQHPVDIVYLSAGRGERTTRVVEPLRLEDRGGATYLIAYCRLRQAERVFRLDRIERAEVVGGE